jgi:hypothetical protein
MQQLALVAQSAEDGFDLAVHRLVDAEVDQLTAQLKGVLSSKFFEATAGKWDDSPRMAALLKYARMFKEIYEEKRGMGWSEDSYKLVMANMQALKDPSALLDSWKRSDPVDELAKRGASTTFAGRVKRATKNVVSVFLPIFVLLVQFGYLFFVFHEIFSSYDAGVCPGYWYNSSITLAPPDNGADAQVLDPDDNLALATDCHRLPPPPMLTVDMRPDMTGR